jgi:hypothetical protein
VCRMTTIRRSCRICRRRSSMLLCLCRALLPALAFTRSDQAFAYHLKRTTTTANTHTYTQITLAVLFHHQPINEVDPQQQQRQQQRPARRRAAPPRIAASDANSGDDRAQTLETALPRCLHVVVVKLLLLLLKSILPSSRSEEQDRLMIG